MSDIHTCVYPAAGINLLMWSFGAALEKYYRSGDLGEVYSLKVLEVGKFKIKVLVYSVLSESYSLIYSWLSSHCVLIWCAGVGLGKREGK